MPLVTLTAVEPPYGRNGCFGVDSSRLRARIRDSIDAMPRYAQCVVVKYDGTAGSADPSRSRRIKRPIWPRRLR